MIRTPIAICAPLALGFATGRLEYGLLLAVGGLVSSIVERGGPYLGRVRRIGVVAVLGGAAGLAIGDAVHGSGWLTVLAMTALALVSALISAAGNIGSVTGLQLLITGVLAAGPLGMITPWWTAVLLYLAGIGWGVGLAVIGWLVFPRAPERRVVAEAYRSVAGMMRAMGTTGFEVDRQAATAALNTAYDELLTARAGTPGADSRLGTLVAQLNQTHRISESVIALAATGRRPSALLPRTVDALADAIQYGEPVPEIPRPPARADTGTGPGPVELALWSALTETAALIAGQRPRAAQRGIPRRGVRGWLRDTTDEIRAGPLVRMHALRLMLCMGVAAVLSETAPLQRSYWVMLTVAIVLKPDFGSVFVRAVQRGLGTVIGAAGGAVLLAALPYGPVLLIPMAVLAFAMPYGMSRNYGMFATFLTPLVVLLIDLLNRGGWPLAQARLVDTAVGCAVVLLIGYLPWPGSWHVHVRPQFADAVCAVADYLDHALSDDPAGRSRLRRQTYRRLSDLRAALQRALSEPAAIGRRASGWYPTVVALEATVDAITATAVIADGGEPRPAPRTVAELVDALHEIAGAVRAGEPPHARRLPDDPAARTVTAAVQDVQSVFDNAA